MTVEGRTIAKEVLLGVAMATKKLSPAPKLAIITCAPNFETSKYLELKKRRAAEAGITVSVIELMADSTTSEVVQTVAVVADQSDGVVVQLPLPEHIDTDKVVAAIPYSHDVDGIHYDGTGIVLPPVIGAIVEISKKHDITFSGKQVVVVGAGRLVGTPALLWATAQGAKVTVITRESEPAEKANALQKADIIISGAGTPHMITPDQIKDGVVLFDAGTSEDGGVLSGDMHPSCVEIASLVTPVPGGVGPITVACLLKNLVTLSRQ